MQNVTEPPKTSSDSKTTDSREMIWRRAAAGINGMDRTTFMHLMEGLWELTGRRTKMSTVQLNGWYIALSDLTEEHLGFAIREYLTTRSSEYLTPQLIRELSGIQTNRDAAAINAYDEAVAAIAKYGSYATPRFSDPAIPIVIRHFGGWVAFCGKPSAELQQFVRPQFLKTYNAMNNATSGLVPRMTNLCEIENTKTGMTGLQDRITQRITDNQQNRIPQQVTKIAGPA